MFLALIGGTCIRMKTLRSSVEHESDENIEGLRGPVSVDALQSVFAGVGGVPFSGTLDRGRIRATPKLTFNMKLENNFYTNLSFWTTTTVTPRPNSKGNEFGISSGVGWTF